MNKGMTTADVPPQFLKAAYLVGKTPRMALASDQRISYQLYIPPDHYNPNPRAPSRGDESKPAGRLPLLVYVHGNLRSLAPFENDLIPFAESVPCAVVAPLFPAGLDNVHDLDSYKLLRSSTLRSDTAMLDTLDEIGHRWPGIATDKVFMMGFSGGGQFTHRFLYLYPDRLVAASVGAPGLATKLDPSLEWPAGIAHVSSIFGREVDASKIANVKTQLIVGTNDNATHGGEAFWDWLRKQKLAQSKGDTSSQSSKAKVTGRRDALQQLHASWAEHGIHAEYNEVDDAAHEWDKVREHVLSFLKPLLEGRREELSK